MSRLLICASALFGFGFPVQAQSKDGDLPAGAIARLGEARVRHVGRVFSVAFAPDGKTLLAAAWDGSIRLWDVATGKELLQYPGHSGWVRSVAFAPDGKTFVSGGKEKIIRLRETATGKELRRFEGHPDWIQYLAFSPNGKTLASRGTGQTIYLWDTASGRQVRQIALQPHTPSDRACFAFSPDGKLLAYPGDVRSIALFDLATGKVVHRIQGYPYWSQHFAFSPDGAVLAASGGWPQFWDMSSGKELRPLKNRGNGPVWSLAFSPDGRVLATSNGDHSLCIWELATRRERWQFESPDKKPAVLAFSPDGRILAQGSEDITVLLWDAIHVRGKGRPQSASLSAKELEELWQQLASEFATTPFRAIGKLAAGSKDSVPFIREHLRPVPPVDAHIISQLVADLDSDRFETRDLASERLEKIGELAEPELRRGLRDNPPLERRQRIERLLEKITGQRENPTPRRRRMLRAVEALEHMDTPTARRALEEYAKGATGAELTRQANAALRRLAKRP